MNTILFRCPACPAQKVMPRVPTDPPEAVAVEIHCDVHGSIDEERIVPRFFDAAGRVIDRAPEAA